jgi:hypothetical protein
MPVNSASPGIVLARGNFYLSRELCETYLPGITAVALLERAGAILIVPLAPSSAGGLLLKQRNARGDRVIQAQEFVRDKGLPEEFEPRTVAVHWNPDSHALSLDF